MQPPSPQPGTVFRAALTLCLLSLPLTAWQQTANSADDDDDSVALSAAVTLHPKLRGDVEITIETTGLHKPVDLVAILRSAMNCDWRGPSTGSSYVGEPAATCFAPTAEPWRTNSHFGRWPSPDRKSVV